MKILLIHGVGRPEKNDPTWPVAWETVVSEQLSSYGVQSEFQAVPYDDIFADPKYKYDAVQYAKAVEKLLAGLIWHGITDPFTSAAQRDMATRGIGDEIHWRAGIVAQWLVQKDLQAACRQRILENIQGFGPDVVCAHSLGTLLSYDLFTHDNAGRAAIKGRTYLTFGSQIGHPAVADSMWGGRVTMVGAKFWHHLYNPHDPVFTQEIRLNSEPDFSQTTTSFGGWFLDFSAHDAVTTPNGKHSGYLDHPITHDSVWRTIAGGASARAFTRSLRTVSKITAPPERRALLVGINDYPDPANRLEGCVNDVFLVSSLLQESGFKSEKIRVVLNERATREGILERLHWLLDEAEDGQERVLFYSGHGAQMPAYGAKEEVDHMDECLVPYDFDWSREHAITDDDFFALYSQLPYDTRFFTIFDCCHSGGMTRDGSRKIRGITPPDDIRHRVLRWNMNEEMWEARPLPSTNPNLGGGKAVRRKFLGRSGATHRLGRAMPLRTLPQRQYNRVRKQRGHRGPFLPVIFEACSEQQYSYEYRHGVTSYGAFTYAMAKNLRALREAGRHPSFEQLIERTNDTLRTLKYDQTAQLVGPSKVINKSIPGKPAAKRSKK